jgi:anti-anti-sigma factor
METIMLEISSHSSDNRLVLALKGRVDASGSKTLEESILAHLEQGHTRLILDCTEMNYISSAGLRSFLMAAKKIREIPGGTLDLCALAPAVREVFEISGFSQIFSIHQDMSQFS